MISKSLKSIVSIHVFNSSSWIAWNKLGLGSHKNLIFKALIRIIMSFGFILSGVSSFLFESNLFWRKNYSNHFSLLKVLFDSKYFWFVSIFIRKTLIQISVPGHRINLHCISDFKFTLFNSNQTFKLYYLHSFHKLLIQFAKSFSNLFSLFFYKLLQIKHFF